MKLGPSLIGAIVGALVGVAAQIGLESAMGHEAIWFALVVGLLTGLGARLMAGGGIAKASFIRAGLAAFVALAGIFGASYASSELTRKKSEEAYEASPPPPARTEVVAEDPMAEEDANPEPAESPDTPTDDATGTESATGGPVDGEDTATPDTEATTETSETAEAPTPTSSTAPELDPARRALSVEPKNLPRQPLNVWQLVWVTVGVLMAYELSRGGSRHS